MSSEQNKIVIKHQEDLVKTFFSLDDERLGMKHFRYTNDDFFYKILIPIPWAFLVYGLDINLHPARPSVVGCRTSQLLVTQTR